MLNNTNIFGGFKKFTYNCIVNVFADCCQAGIK